MDHYFTVSFSNSSSYPIAIKRSNGGRLDRVAEELNLSSVQSPETGPAARLTEAVKSWRCGRRSMDQMSHQQQMRHPPQIRKLESIAGAAVDRLHYNTHADGAYIRGIMYNGDRLFSTRQ